MMSEANSARSLLLVFGKQANPITVTGDIPLTHEFLKKEFNIVFPGQINNLQENILQKWDEKWKQWVDLCNEPIMDKCKIRLIKRESDVPRFGNLDAKYSAFLCCDMQERFKPHIKYFNEITQVANRLLKGAYLLDVPVIVTEQYPKGLLHTVKELDVREGTPVIPKTLFSMIVPEVEEKIPKGLKSAILFGVEAHVCIQKTALDLLSRGVEVHVIADACSSRSQTDRLLAFERLRAQGAIITTAETVLLQLVKDKEHPKFKEMQDIIKVLPPDTGIAPMR